MKLTQSKFNRIHKQLTKGEAELIFNLAKEHKVSYRTIKRIQKAETYPGYKILVRGDKPGHDWLTKRGYEDMPFNFIRKLVKR